ncbi:hypothetical protein [Blautia sp. MSJ-19]|uniref:hypothetical protein n=1 Tax=Blautia sp. MSJ-19 TaxID=2841517 RepID=UPI001C0EAB2C|nr:hypothetical protein [Blautia sp. MSJ-19]MBU5482145.1 hypothetical protein [Blautia sp. MSJ-19]
MDKGKDTTNVRRSSGSAGARKSRASSVKKARRAKARHSVRKSSGIGSDIREVIARLPKSVLAGAAALLVLIIIIVFAARGCGGVSHKTPERVVKNLIEAYTSGSESKVQKCYGVSKADDTLQQEIDATVKYFQAFEAEKTEVTQCDKIYEDGKNTYMYITYNLVLKNGQSYPCISTYMVQKKDDGKYYVMTPSEITDDLSKQAATKYADFMNTQVYKDYTTAYDKFIKKNPGYEEKIAAKLK